MAAAAARANRSVETVTLVAVTKYAELDWVRALIELGVRDLGESRPQQLAARARDLPADVRWHLIGHLQRNKVDLVLPVTHCVEAVDSIRLAEAIDAAAQKRGQPTQALIEVNVSGETSKDGFSVEGLLAAWPRLRELPQIEFRGLMTMAPQSDDPEMARPVFRALRELRDQLAEPLTLPLPDLSMGMSGDFEIGIEEGATLVRVGSALFDGLTPGH